ncbi:MAG: type II toxin-antitoxin system Phd/YefM family antitoxin [Chloroflexota bacterium]|nr:type II toxin-antitoxin system Phd/YefM family antitoxin [Chloroflexota bacterium]
MEKRLGVTKARQDFSGLVDRVQHRGEAYIISKHGEPVAAVVPLEVYKRWKEERERLFDTIREIQRANPGADPEQVMREALKAQRAVRRSSKPLCE